MAAPASKTLQNLSGKWTMNKTLSGDFDSMLTLQGIGWLLRKTIGVATVTLAIKQYVNDDPEPSSTHIDIDQTATGGIKGTTEIRVLNWARRDHKDGIFGELYGRSRWVKLEDLGDEYAEEGDKEFLSEGWEEVEGGQHIQSWVKHEKGGEWTANQVWGFQTIDGKRYYCRNVVLHAGKEVRKARLVYDFVSE